MDFIADWLNVLHLSKEALVPTPVEGAPSIGFGTHDDFNDEAPALQSEQTLWSNPAVSNVHAVIHILRSILRQIPGGTPLSPTQPPYDRFPYGLASSAHAYAWGL